MKEFLKSLGYTIAGLAFIIGVIILAAWVMEVLGRVNPALPGVAVAIFLILLITCIVHASRMNDRR